MAREVTLLPRGGRGADPLWYDVFVEGFASLEDGPVAKVYLNDYRAKGTNATRQHLAEEIRDTVRRVLTELDADA